MTLIPPDTQPTHHPGRRRFLQTLLASAVTSILTACGLGNNQTDPTATTAPEVATLPTSTAAPISSDAPPPIATEPISPTSEAAATEPIAPTATTQTLAPTPACGDDDDEPTPQQTEGPFYTPNTPERTSFLEDGITGTPLLVTGAVLTTDCLPVAGALIDFWHADDNGVYDNTGFKLRGHQFADDNGRYTLQTILPGLYPGRTRHIHVKVQAPNQPVLTTQLYFPNEPGNASDSIFDAALLMDVQADGDGQAAAFNFVLNL